MTESQPTTISVRKITLADQDRAIDVMTRAFDDDPVLNYFVWQDARREQRMRTFMEAGLKQMTFPYGETYVSDGFEGAAFWNPPNGRPHGLLSDLKMLPAFLKVTTLRGLPRAMSALSAVEKKHPKEPHYYLLAIGVDPNQQGRGIGSQLLAPMLERCDREGMPSYLESSKERNVPLYQRHGYRVIEEMRVGTDGPLVWRMWRDPQS